MTALATYGLTLHPSVAGGDSGELAAVAHTMGTAHPPGYPLYTMLAKAFTYLPFGSIAARVNLLSAVLDAAAAVAEVFALNDLLAAVVLLLALRFHADPDARVAIWLMLALGLDASNHHTIVLFGAPLGAWIVLRGPDSLRRPRELARLAAVFAVGLLAALRREGPSGVAAVTALGVGVYLVVFSTLANLSFDNALLYGVIARFWQQPTVWICAWAGLGMAAVFEWIEGRVPTAARVAAPLCAACAVALVALQIGTNYSSQDQHANTVVADYGRGILASLPSNALLISLGDLDTNSLRYLQLCEDVRPDVRVIGRAMLRYPWMRSVLLRNLADVALPDRPFDRRARRPAGVASLTDLIDANARRAPVFGSRLNADEDRAWTQRYDSWPYVELARDVLKSLAASHPDPPAGLSKNAGLAYHQLARFDPTRVDGMVRWWTRYLEVAPASDDEAGAIRQLLEQTAAGN